MSTQENIQEVFGATARATGRATRPVEHGRGVSAGERPDSLESCHERLTVSAVVHPSGRDTGGRKNTNAKKVGLRVGERGPGRAGLESLLGQLSERDLAILDLIGQHRFLTTAHVTAFIFPNHASAASASRSARRVLARLERDRLLERPIRRVGGLMAGSASSIWMLTSVGQRLRAVRDGRGAVGRVRAPGQRFIAHYLAIADTHLALAEAERAGQLSLHAVDIEPRCWRSFTGLGGEKILLKPDLSAVTSAASSPEFEDHWFIEVDRGTESLPTLIRQCQLYERYRRTGIAQAEAGVYPLVVWVVPDERRAGQLQAVIARTKTLDAGIFRVTTPEDFTRLITGHAT